MDLHAVINKAMQSVVANMAIRRMMLRRINPDQFKLLIIQKALIRSQLIRQLTMALDIAEEQKLEPLTQSLRRNLCDETGFDAEGKMHPENSHATWQSHFLNALDITPAVLKRARPLSSVIQYNKQMHYMELKGDLYEILGAILMTERIIPLEFRAIQLSRDFLFTSRFVIAKTDGREEIFQKRLACQYIDHHILHDSNEHYPDFLNAINQIYLTPPEEIRLIRGIHLIRDGRCDLYNDIYEQWELNNARTYVESCMN
ncbi:MAG TPA: iron-containing redox enzyme family protein [Coxiellaceae bacterium]|nr:iron-containing redox enzyme family protein [Coxiellaceae bacterium]